MKAAIMQPYFLPYIGYYQLICAVDVFVVYDNIKYTKKGWINRNRMLVEGREHTFTLPLKADADDLHVCERELAPSFDRQKLRQRIASAYARAPFFADTMPVVERILAYPGTNLFAFVRHSLSETCTYLGIDTPMLVSSAVPVDHGLRGQERVIAIAKAVGATTYVNPIGGTELYAEDVFRERGLSLTFLRSKPVSYRHGAAKFVPWLSILDVLMWNSPDQRRQLLEDAYELLAPGAVRI